MSNLEVAYLSATEQLRLFATRDLSPVDVLEAQIAQAGIAEPVINAFSETLYDDARKAALPRRASTSAGGLDSRRQRDDGSTRYDDDARIVGAP